MAQKPTNVTGSVHINGVAPKHDTTSINRGLEPSGVGEHRLYPPAPFDCNCPQLLSPLGLQDTLQGGAGVPEQRGGKEKGLNSSYKITTYTNLMFTLNGIR